MNTFLKLGIGLILCMGINSCTEVGAKNHHHDNIEMGGRCTGSATCRACSNCKYCKHCNSGGRCGVCR